MLKRILTILLISVFIPVYAKITVPSVISDNMVLQRDSPVKLWGWANKGETVTIEFNGQKITAKTDKNGLWKTQLKPMQYGGPFDMLIKGKNDILTIKNILIGDVWVCSGQSNMEWVVSNSNNAKNEISAANYPGIRLFTVAKNMSALPLNNVESTGWKECSPETIPNFSAVSYYFGRTLHDELDIPIGLINSSWGGTMIESWTSIPTMSTLPEYSRKLDEIKETGFKEMVENSGDNLLSKFLNNEQGSIQQWFLPKTDIKDWKTTNLPALWTDFDIDGNGVIWYRKEFTLTAEQAKSEAIINLGKIDDWDETFLNGYKIGATRSHIAERKYTVAPRHLKTGKNILVVKVTNVADQAGFYDKAENMFCKTVDSSIPLSGEWYYKISGIINPGRDIGPNTYPSLLYNAMIAPLSNYTIKGAIWYQGESNAGEAFKYRTLFPNMIKDWRAAWQQGDFPFYFVQLANYMAAPAIPSDSDWAKLREAQHMTLSIPNTGEAVAIDIGEANDIHPRDKQTVGYRLALNALAKTYHKNIEYQGPEYESMEIAGDKIIIKFNTKFKLVAKSKYGYLNSFAIAGNDKKFVWAKAFILDDNRIEVYSPEIKEPIAVRYAWANNPDDANLYNSEELPASPFRTDSW